MEKDINQSQKQSFVFYRSFANSINRLPADIQLPLYKAITDYALDMKVPSFDDCQDRVFLEAVWESIRPQLDANQKRYLNGCKGGKYGKLGGAPKGNQNACKKQPLNNPKTTPNDNVNDNVNDIIKKNKQKNFVKPCVEEIKEYCTERNNSVDAGRFFDYYEANGWRVGKNPMKDWKAAVRTWERKALPIPQPQREYKSITNANSLEI